MTSVNGTGNNGGSRGGGACNCGTSGGNGGSGGSSGLGCTYVGGDGQGLYASNLTMFTQKTISAGAGGAGGNSTCAGGGGAGGILIDGVGSNAQDGAAIFSGKGGLGYGAGGGAGGYEPDYRYGGGNGANGLVYIEW